LALVMIILAVIDHSVIMAVIAVILLASFIAEWLLDAKH
jgi:hypothetical protein